MPVMHHDRVPALTPVPLADRLAWRDADPSAELHAGLMRAVPALRQIETGGEGIVPATRDGSIHVAAWNMERCLFPANSARVLRRMGVDLALLTEMDVGCHRTFDRHTMADMAAELGHAYAYGLEFLELASMARPGPADAELADALPPNALGFHGNGFTTALPFVDPVLIRLSAASDWFADPKDGQKRVGGRMAVAACFAHGDHTIVGCSVHLESRSTAAGRLAQMRDLLDALDSYADGHPVVIGGDLNTEVEPGGWTDPAEPLFALAQSRGYDWSACNCAQPTTRPSLWSSGAGTRQLDWFCTRGFAASLPQVVPALNDDGTVLSDHDLIVVTLTPR